MSPLTPRQQELKDRFIAVRGFWIPFWEEFLRADADFFEAYIAFSGWPAKHGALSAKLRELVYIAVDAATHHLHAFGTRNHIANALQHGASREEIIETLALVSQSGTQTLQHALPILVDELRHAGVIDAGSLAEQSVVADVAIDEWNDGWALLADEDPGFLEAVRAFRNAACSGNLSELTRELLLLAVSSACTNLDPVGTRTHIRRALEVGGTLRMILDVLELVSVIGIHSFALGLPLIDEAMEQ